MADEFTIRRLAGLLTNLLHELDGLKVGRRLPQRSERVMKPTPGPQAPGDLDAISLHAEIERSLQRWASTLAGTGDRIPHSARALCNWVGFNAYAIASHTDADAFQDELAAWCAQVEKAVGRGPTLKQVARTATDARSTCTTAATAAKYASAALGKTITRKQVTYWARAGYITVEHRDGKRLYNLAEVHDFAATYQDRRDFM